jgi:hypothetical protein
MWTKKIKKTKKSPKSIMYKNEEYEIDNWVQCDKCNIWRKITGQSNLLLKKIQNGEQFLCKKVDK